MENKELEQAAKEFATTYGNGLYNHTGTIEFASKFAQSLLDKSLMFDLDHVSDLRTDIIVLHEEIEKIKNTNQTFTVQDLGGIAQGIALTGLNISGSRFDHASIMYGALKMGNKLIDRLNSSNTPQSGEVKSLGELTKEHAVHVSDLQDWKDYELPLSNEDWRGIRDQIIVSFKNEWVNYKTYIFLKNSGYKIPNEEPNPAYDPINSVEVKILEDYIRGCRDCADSNGMCDTYEGQYCDPDVHKKMQLKQRKTKYDLLLASYNTLKAEDNKKAMEINRLMSSVEIPDDVIDKMYREDCKAVHGDLQFSAGYKMAVLRITKWLRDQLNKQ